MNLLIIIFYHVKDYLSLIKHNYKSSKALISNKFFQYTKNNYNFWKKINNTTEKNIFIAVDCTHHSPSTIIHNLILAKHFQKIHQFNILVIDTIKNKHREKIYKSFLVSKTIYINSFFYFLENYLIYKKEIKKINNINELIHYKYKKIEIGKIAYDDFLRRTFLGTASKINYRIKYFFFKCIKTTNLIEKILINFNIKIYCTHEQQFNPEAILFTFFLKNRVKIFVKGTGQTEIGLRKFQKYSQRLYNRHSVTKNIFYKALKANKKFDEIGYKIINNKFNNEPDINDIADISFVFNNSKKIVDKEYLANLFQWDIKKPMVYVFAHNIYDGVFEKREYLFIDNYIWLIETLKLLCQNKNINILVKEHPTEHFGSKVHDKTKNVVNHYKKDNSNIEMFPDNLHPKTIMKSAHCLFTGWGSAGLEYSTIGIPTIIAADAPYYRVGFAYESRNVLEYEKLIKNIHLIQKLNNEQIKKACVFAYVFNVLTKVKTSLNSYCNRLNDTNEPEYWQRLSNNLVNYNFDQCIFHQMLKKMLKKNTYNIIDYNKFE
jgi:hypothetical protein